MVHNMHSGFKIFSKAALRKTHIQRLKYKANKYICSQRKKNILKKLGDSLAICNCISL